MSQDTTTMTITRETPATSKNGYTMLLVLLAIPIIAFAGAFALSGIIQPLAVMMLILAVPLFILTVCGFYMLQPNQSAVLTLFGEYQGTDRSEGLRWVLPWIGRKKVSLRVHNVHSDRVKINDFRGNPIEVACNVVWRVSDTAQATFDVDDYKAFADIQIEAALRTVGARYPYDNMTAEDTVTLRGSADIINQELRVELNERIQVAGILVDEAGLTHLAYAPEIAGAMLRRQQADAVIAARKKVVIGAVGMVEDALSKLSEDGIIDLDDERKAAMVTNLMVVLCSDRETQPIVNTGTLHQ